MATSRTLIKTLSSANLVFGLDWFAVLGNTPAREIRRIARQQKATHVVHAGDDAASVGVTSLPPVRRGMVLYSAAQLVAQRFSTGVIALIAPLDDQHWWLVAVHDGAVIARTDCICQSFDEATAQIGPLRQAYPALILLDDEQRAPSLTDLGGQLYPQARLRRPAYGSALFSRPYRWLILMVAVIYLIHLSAGRVLGFFSAGDTTRAPDLTPLAAWQSAVHTVTSRHWVHGVTGTSDVLLSLYALPVDVAGWRLREAQCISSHDQWRCHADYARHDADASNTGFLAAAPASWDTRFTPLEQAQVHWSFESGGLSLATTTLNNSRHTERQVFSSLQAIRPAFALMTIDAPEPLRIPAPVDESGQAIPQPDGLPQFRLRTVRIQAPLRSLSLLLPHSEAMTWQRVTLGVNTQARPDLTHSQLNVTLQGVLYEQD